MRILITGGAGFVGSNIATYLAERNETITIIDNLSTGNLDNIKDIKKKIKFIQGDINNLKLMQKVTKNQDFIIHQAALPSVQRSVIDPISSNYNNINGTLNILNAAKKNNVKRVIIASSSSIYGDINCKEKYENLPYNPLSPYAVTKITAEMYAKIYYNIYGLETVCLRYFNVFGPKQNPNSQYSAVIPRFIRAIINNQSPIIYGDGRTTRDFTYVTNNVVANIKACTAKKAPGEIINIATNSAISLNKLVFLINKKLNKNIEPIYKDFRMGDIKHSLANINKAIDILRYKVIVDFEDGIERTIDWYRS